MFSSLFLCFEGAITGPIGSGASTFAKGASGFVKFGVRAGAGAAAGMTLKHKSAFSSHFLDLRCCKRDCRRDC